MQKAVERAFALQGLPKGRPEDDPQSYLILRQMWGTHQNFFRGLCLAAKVERIAELAQARLAGGFSVVLGLQATGAPPPRGKPRNADSWQDHGVGRAAVSHFTSTGRFFTDRVCCEEEDSTVYTGACRPLLRTLKQPGSFAGATRVFR